MLIEIVTPNDVSLPAEKLQSVCDSINTRLLAGVNTYEIEINYLLRDKLKEIFSKAWVVTAKEYKNTIKLTFREKELAPIIEIIYESN